MTIRQKTVVTMKIDGACPSHTRTEISVRDLHATIDEPEARGGTNKGLTPTETLLASLLGCTNVIAHKVADKHGVKFSQMQVKVEAQFDRRGVFLEEEIDIPFPEVRLSIDVTTNANSEAIDRVKSDLGRYCPVAKVLRQAGTAVIEEWKVRSE